MAAWRAAMSRALELGEEAGGRGDVPVGAVILGPADPASGECAVLGEGANERELTGDPTAHAEILAIRRAAAALRGAGSPGDERIHRRTADSGPFGPKLGVAREIGLQAPPVGWRLESCTLVVTLEPCTMCAGALVAARIGRLVFGAFDPKAGAVSSLWDVVRDPRINHRVDVSSGILAEESSELLRRFFGDRR